ncbi:hypothetical protein HD554DRAFT_2012682 [Boletus coccyginus]|nr:hypothetical protein HD554DRAFT_2012682 [Boletus coccyginus]
MVADTLPIDKSNFTLDTSGVAGVFGGDEAVSAMATVNIYHYRRWLGWYNSPGSYQIAKRYGRLAKSKFFHALFPGVHIDPAELFELDGLKGPKFIAAHSGTIIEETGHLAALIVRECATREGTSIGWRETQTVGVTIVELHHIPPTQVHPRRFRAYSSFFASIPIAVSIVACVTCGVFKDWYSCSLIFLGMLTTGTCCFVIGSGRFVFTHPDPADGSPPGDGILKSDKQIVLLKGAEGAVNSITRGRFSLNFASGPQHNDIGWCSVLLIIQFVTQLLLIPQGSLFGQIMFVFSLGVSWIYNSCLSFFDKEEIQREILINTVLETPHLTKYTLGTHTTMVVFVLLVLQPEEPIKVLDGLLPNDTKVWRRWKETIVGRLLRNEKLEFVDADWELGGFSQQNRSLLKTLYRDAQAAYGGYVQYITPN